jgi:hypothetical protein
VPIGGIMFNLRAGGVYGSGNFTMTGRTISENTANFGGGVYVIVGTFIKTGGTVYGDLPANTTHTPGSNENTATVATNPGTNGHAVMLSIYPNYYYRNETLNTGDNISSTDTLPTTSGQTVGKWTKR